MSMCYNNPLADSENEIWSNFYLLVDTVIKDDEEEQRRLLTEKQEESKCRKTRSEEEQSQKGFHFPVPRYLRPYLENRRYPQRSRDLNGACLSLLDLNQTPQNPSSEPMVCDKELRKKRYADSGKKIRSNLDLLVDAAIKVDEEEQRRLLTEKQEESKCRKTLSEEEQSQKGFSFRVPRYLRSSLVNRRYPQPSRDLNGASLALLDLNQTPQNPSSEPMVRDEELRAKKGKSKIIVEDEESDQKRLFEKTVKKFVTRSRRYAPQPSYVNPSSEPVVCDEELLRAKKGKAKVVYEDDDEDEDTEKRLFEKNLRKFVTRSRRYPQPSYENLNGASTSSSLPKLRCVESSLYYNTAESEKTETKDPPDPNDQSSSSPSSCLTENTSRKRRPLPQRKSKGGFKKAKVDPFPREPRETPEWVIQVIRDMNGDAENPRLVFERTLTTSDVNPEQSRLLMPFKQLFRNDFLTYEESRAIRKEVVNKEDEENIGVGTILVNQRSQMWGLRFKIWAMEKESGHGTLNYILNWGWNDVVKGNSLKKDDKISLWTFRCRGVLCFVLGIVRKRRVTFAL